MDYNKFSNWLWDIAKYVVTAVIISTFLGDFRDNAVMLYGGGFVLAASLFILGIHFQIKSKKQQ